MAVYSAIHLCSVLCGECNLFIGGATNSERQPGQGI